jgi:hypothetical protein
MTDQAELHNKLAGEIVGDIVRPVMASGGNMSSALVVLESVVLGILLMNEKTGGASGEAVLNVIADAVRKRLPEAREETAAPTAPRH